MMALKPANARKHTYAGQLLMEAIDREYAASRDGAMEKPRQAIPGLTPPPWTAHGTWVSAGENGDGPLVADFEYDVDAVIGSSRA